MVAPRRAIGRFANYGEGGAEFPRDDFSWDITRLRGSLKWQFFYLYVLIDIFSRYVVGWLLAQAESAACAAALIATRA